MGRRTLPKIDPGVDVRRHLIELESLTEPFDPQRLFPNVQPLELEIGSGKGHFLLAESRQSEQSNFLGIEIAGKYARFAASRLAMHDLANARIIFGDGLRLFKSYLPNECASAVHIYFPDPWWKARHQRRRVMQPQFIADIERVLKPAGVLHFWTDVEAYYQDTLQLLAECSPMQGPFAVAEVAPSHEMDYRTHFERRMRINGHDVFRAQFSKP